MITIDEALPISAAAEEIAEAIRAHPVVIVAGETGSGKTTQLPKICLGLGRSAIAHTQPRRIAARSVAERVAQEMGSELGADVGYRVRFTRKAGRDTRLVIMTDGVLLNEIGFDRDLRRYDTIIIDEAHERSLNIDFLLGYLKQLITRRDDLKIIVTSATIDTARFAAHFDDAPIIEVSGRTYPVEVRYRPLYDDGDDAAPVDPDRDQIAGVLDAVDELGRIDGHGDILVFLSGEREIRDTAQAIEAKKLRLTEVVPLYARLSAAEQHKVFSSHTGRRIVLATNVAETSLTVPGIRYVIDAGTARISRYSARTKVQRLPIEPISQASANQRSGRCGRVAPGVAIRLYSEQDYLARPEFTEPEILRTNLASVILQMAQARLGDIARFPFVEAPDSSQIADGLRLLTELGAIKDADRGTEPRLTRIGQRLARIPVDPRMARMLVAGADLHCLREVMIIVAGLSIQDPRERPADRTEAADLAHRRFWAPLPSDDGTSPDPPPADPPRGRRPARDDQRRDDQPDDRSDFLAWLRMWEYVRGKQRELSGNAFRRMCREEFLHYLRIREWQDLHTQLRDIAKDLELERNREPADPAAIHTAILTGLLSQVGLAEISDAKAEKAARGRGRRPLREYLGARGARFAIQPGSSLARTPPPLVMAAELVETSRLWARTVAAIDARWVEQVGGHLIKRQYSEPHWSTRAQAVQAYETVSLYGVPIISRRTINYGRIDPVVSRDIFIRSALVEGQWRTRHRFWQHNQRVRAEAEELEERTRRRDILVDDETIAAFYDARLPAEVVSATHFDTWWNRTRGEQPDLLDLQLSDLIHVDADEVDRSDFPDRWRIVLPSGSADIRLSYVFDPGSNRDGVTATVPLSLLNQVPADPFTWQVPGLRTELATELIRGLPKAIRTSFVPAPDHARRALGWLTEHGIGPDDRSLPAALAEALRALTGHRVPESGDGGFDTARVPDRLRVTFVVTDGDQVVADGKDLTELARRLRPTVTAQLNRAARDTTRSKATTWVFDTVADEVALSAAGASGRRGQARAVGHPALTEEPGGTVGLVVYETAASAERAARRGLRRLVLLNTPDPTKWVFSHLSNHDKLALTAGPYPDLPALLADARLASVGSLITVPPRSIRTGADFAALCDTVRTDNAERMRDITRLAADAVRRHGEATAALPGVADAQARADLTEQLSNLVFPGFLGATAYPHLAELPRYLQAAVLRIEALRATPAKERQAFETVMDVEDEYAELCAAQPDGPLPEPLVEVGWLIEDLRVSLFAQRLGTRRPISAKRIRTAMAEARRELVAS